ncbi:hypothetical protein F4556_006639 [Kitasatospora gansuensis]|uniref:Uncharacterized protein n=2 Tax=Kitasatospora TaxID=2063 RepID=A0A7W7WLT4_9ACTN|nr:hypothetical protein [Kitasatospora gansuensis]
MPDRYEARLLPPVGAAEPLWGAWDLKNKDWVRVPSPDRRPEWFTTEARVSTWAAQQASGRKVPSSTRRSAH